MEYHKIAADTPIYAIASGKASHYGIDRTPVKSAGQTVLVSRFLHLRVKKPETVAHNGGIGSL